MTVYICNAHNSTLKINLICFSCGCFIYHGSHHMRCGHKTISKENAFFVRRPSLCNNEITKEVDTKRNFVESDLTDR